MIIQWRNCMHWTYSVNITLHSKNKKVQTWNMVHAGRSDIFSQHKSIQNCHGFSCFQFKDLHFLPNHVFPASANTVATCKQTTIHENTKQLHPIPPNDLLPLHPSNHPLLASVFLPFMNVIHNDVWFSLNTGNFTRNKTCLASFWMLWCTIATKINTWKWKSEWFL